MIKVGVVGGSGRLGVELLRLLVMHPNVRIQAVTSRTFCGQRIQDRFPIFRHHFEAQFVPPTVDQFAKCDVVFFATPAGVALELAPQLLEKRLKVIDFSGDFRIRDAAVWQQLHGKPHPQPGLLNESVMGFPEIQRMHLRKARLVGMPSAEAIALQIALLPLLDVSWQNKSWQNMPWQDKTQREKGELENGVLENSQITGTLISGIGQASMSTAASLELNSYRDSIRSTTFDASTRHEIQAGLQAIAGDEVALSIIPHQVPVMRGMHATLFARLREPVVVDLQALYERYFDEEPFVDIQPSGQTVDASTVLGANMCRISVQHSADQKTAIILSVIDNLVKGAAGQAIQAMNIMHGIPEAIGLKHLALMP